MMLFEVRRAAAAVAEVLRAESPSPSAEPVRPAPVPGHGASPPLERPGRRSGPAPVGPASVAPAPVAAAPVNRMGHGSTSYAPGGTVLPGEPPAWS